MIPKKVPEDAVGATTPETKPRVPFAVGDTASWDGVMVRVEAMIPDFHGEPRVLVRAAIDYARFFVLRDSDLTPWVEPE